MLHSLIAPILFGAVLIFLAFAMTGVAPPLTYGRVPPRPVPVAMRLVFLLVGAALVVGALLGVFKG